MSLDQIKQEIEKKAAKTSSDILEEAAKKVKEIEYQTAMQIQELEKEADVARAKEAEQLTLRELSLANMEGQKRIFEAKKQELKSAYEEAWELIEKMPQTQTEKTLKSLFEKARRQMPVATIYTKSADAKSFASVRVEESPDAGIICDNADGTIRIDYRFQTLYAQVREQTLAEVSRRLFS